MYRFLQWLTASETRGAAEDSAPVHDPALTQRVQFALAKAQLGQDCRRVPARPPSRVVKSDIDHLVPNGIRNPAELPALDIEFTKQVFRVRVIDNLSRIHDCSRRDACLVECLQPVRGRTRAKNRVQAPVEV